MAGGNLKSANNFVIAVMTAFLILSAGHTGAAGAKKYYLFAYFKDGEVQGGGAGLHLAVSENGYRWTELKNGGYFFKVKKSPMFRDPNITRGADGVFNMVWTTGWGSQNIGYASSTDLINWSEERIIPVMANEPKVRNCWAPENFYDTVKKQFIIFWSSTIPGRFPRTDNTGDDGYNHRIYYTTTKDFVSVAPAKLLYNPGFDCIDATIVKENDKYVMILKNETRWPPAKNIVMATAESAEGPYSRPSRPIAGARGWVEGPTAVKIGDRYFVYFDMYSSNRFGVVVSSDLKKWKDESDKLIMPFGIRHGTAFEAPADIVEKLKTRK
jgi:sucrose-6-phosphate hydrolase SacC (GH32 family)